VTVAGLRITFGRVVDVATIPEDRAEILESASEDDDSCSRSEQRALPGLTNGGKEPRRQCVVRPRTSSGTTGWGKLVVSDGAVRASSTRSVGDQFVEQGGLRVG
jgi:hypothetical protein